MDAQRYIFDGHKLIYHIDRLSQYLKEGDCFPLYMEISPSGICNHRCIFCAYDFIGYPKRRLQTHRFLRFIDEIASCGVKSLLYSGEGEPFLHPDIDKFIIYSKQKGIDVGVYTNGQFLNEELVKRILTFLTFIRFSFNGGTKENYIQIHQVAPEVFEKVVNNIERVVEIKRKEKLNLDVGVQYVLLPENITYLISGIKMLKETGIDYFVIKPFVQQSPLQSYQLKEQFDLEDIEDTLKESESFSDENFKVIARRESFKNYGKRDYRYCYGTTFISVLNSGGDIASCLPYWDKKEFILGNIYEHTFREIWNGKKRKEIKYHLENELDIKMCPPNCRPHAINEFLWEIKNPSVKHLNFI